MSEEIKKDMSQKEIGKLAVEIWKLEKRLNKIDSLDEEEQKATSFLLSRINKIIEGYNVKIIDYTGQKFLEGMTGIDILSAETHKDLEYPIIGETVTPAIEINGLIVQRAKVVINTPETVIEENENNIQDCKEGEEDNEQDKKTSGILSLLLLALLLLLIGMIWFIYSKLIPEPIEINQQPPIHLFHHNHRILIQGSINDGVEIENNTGETIENKEITINTGINEKNNIETKSEESIQDISTNEVIDEEENTGVIAQE